MSGEVVNTDLDLLLGMERSFESIVHLTYFNEFSSTLYMQGYPDFYSNPEDCFRVGLDLSKPGSFKFGQTTHPESDEDFTCGNEMEMKKAVLEYLKRVNPQGVEAMLSLRLAEASRPC